MDWQWLIPGVVGFSFCVLCGIKTIWYFAKHITSGGKDTGYDLFQCNECKRMGSARPRDN